MNVAATYGRSLVALFCGLFTSRWMLMALGETDYGLLGVVGALIGFITVLNEILAGGVRRFYGVAIGAGETGEVRAWFRVALTLHLGLAVALLAVGYPIGEWAVRNFIAMPEGRVGACLKVFGFSCAAGFVGMISVPFSAMYTAKQEIAELTVYSFLQTLLTFGFLGWLVCGRVQADNFVLVAGALSAISVGANLLMVVRGFVKYPECSVGRVDGLKGRLKELVGYAMCNAVQAVGYLLSIQGMAVFVNKAFGPAMNGALNVSNSLTGQVGTLSKAMQGAMSPVVNQAYGAGDLETVRRLALRVSKFSVLFIILFTLPLIVELRNVLEIWLVNPPKGAWEIAVLLIGVMTIDAFGTGYRDAVYASGRLRRFTLRCESVLLLVLPVAFLMWWAGMGVWAIGGAYALVTAVNVAGRIWYSRQIVGTSARLWMRELVLPVLLTVAITLGVGFAVHFGCAKALGGRFLVVVVTACACEAVFLPLVWFKVLSAGERNWLVGQIRRRFR